MMDKSEVEDLRKKYPEKFYKVAEKDGKLVVTERRAAIWLPDRFLNKLPSGNPIKLGELLSKALELANLAPQHFKFTQKRVTLKVMCEIAKRSRACKVTRREYINALLEEFLKAGGNGE